MVKSKRKTTVGRTIVFAFLIIWCLTFFGSIAWLFVNSFKDRVQYVTDKVAFPEPWNLHNYIEAFTSLQATEKSVFVMVFNSLWRVVGSIIIAQFCANTVAYVLAKYHFRGRDLIYWLAILTQMIPIYGTMASSLKVYSALGMYDTPLFILNAIGIGGIILPYSCYKNLSWNYAEAAFIDGAGHFRVFYHIMLPQMIPIITALSVTGFIGGWNDYMTSIVYLPSYPSLATGLYIYEVECRRSMNYPILFAGLLMSTIPVLVLFVAFQNTLLELDISGGLKG